MGRPVRLFLWCGPSDSPRPTETPGLPALLEERMTDEDNGHASRVAEQLAMAEDDEEEDGDGGDPGE